MEINSKTVQIKVQNPITTSYIEDKLKEMGIEPLRWAIVKADNNTLTISIAEIIS